MFGQKSLSPVEPSVKGNDFITPVNIKPLSLEQVMRRRALSISKPVKNLIVFTGSGFDGLSAAFFHESTSRRSEIFSMESIERVLPQIICDSKKDKAELLHELSQTKRKVGLITDSPLELPGFVNTSKGNLIESLVTFDVLFSGGRNNLDKYFPGWKKTIFEKSGIFIENKKDLIRSVEKSEGKKALYGVFSPSYFPFGHEYSTLLPSMSELIEAGTNQLLRHEDGFVLLINFTAVERARLKCDYFEMFKQMKKQEELLHMLNTFVSGRKDSLLVVVAKPENGFWKFADNFKLKQLLALKKSITYLVEEMIAKPAEAIKILKNSGYQISIDEAEVKKLSEWKSLEELEQLISGQLNKSLGLVFEPCKSCSFQSGMTVFARGANSNVFDGLSSFKGFVEKIRRLISNNGKKKSK